MRICAILYFTLLTLRKQQEIVYFRVFFKLVHDGIRNETNDYTVFSVVDLFQKYHFNDEKPNLFKCFGYLNRFHLV